MKGRLILVHDDSGYGYGVFADAGCVLRCLDAGARLVLRSAHETVRGTVLRRQRGDEDDWLLRDEIGYERDLADYVRCDAEVLDSE